MALSVQCRGATFMLSSAAGMIEQEKVLGCRLLVAGFTRFLPAFCLISSFGRTANGSCPQYSVLYSDGNFALGKRFHRNLSHRTGPVRLLTILLVTCVPGEWRRTVTCADAAV